MKKTEILLPLQDCYRVLDERERNWDKAQIWLDNFKVSHTKVIKKLEEEWHEKDKFQEEIGIQMEDYVIEHDNKEHFVETFPKDKVRSLKFTLKKLIIKLGGTFSDSIYIEADAGTRITQLEFRRIKRALDEYFKNRKNSAYWNSQVEPRDPKMIDHYLIRLTWQYEQALEDKDERYAKTLLDVIYEKGLMPWIKQQKYGNEYGAGRTITKGTVEKALRGMKLREKFSFENRKSPDFDPTVPKKGGIDWFREITALL